MIYFRINKLLLKYHIGYFTRFSEFTLLTVLISDLLLAMDYPDSS